MNNHMSESANSGVSEAEIAGARRLAITAMLIVFTSFLAMACIGVAMRSNQGQWLHLGPTRFYSLMTLHGLMQVGGLFVGSLYATWYILVRFAGIRPHTRMMWGLLLTTMVGVAGIVIGTVVGKYAPGWYMLYPIEFKVPSWPSWSMGMVTSALLLLGLVWGQTMFLLVQAMGERYGYRNLFGFQYFFSKSPAGKIPPIVLITTVVAIAGILGALSGAAFLITLLIEWINPAIHFNVLMEKNLVLFFGHMIANITLYFVVGVIYEMMPHFTGRPWKTTRVVVIAWLAVLVALIAAYPHHLYMDYAMPVWVEEMGQVVSYMSALPSVVVTIFGLIAQIYQTGWKRWQFVPATFAVGAVGWVIGGFAAIVDSTISNNFVLHNTLWVPAHFHTYYLMGVFLWLLGIGFYLVDSRAERMAKGGLALMVVAGYGFLSMFYVGGVLSVPRRYAEYAHTGFINHAIAHSGAWTAQVGAVCAAFLILGYLVYLASLGFPRRDRLAEPDTPESRRETRVVPET